MRLTAEQFARFGDDGGLIHAVDTAFSENEPKTVGIAVSGGGDSMALLHAAIHRADLAGTALEAVTVDHGLREEAAEEANMVARYCATFGIPHTTLKWNGADASGNIASAGRDARYRLISNWAKSRAIGGVLLGHTLDDIAETFLMRLARKSGVDGLSMMETQFERNGMRWSRPFWQHARADLRDYLIRHGVSWVDDPTNDDEAYERPKARQVLAALAPLGITADVLKTVAMNMTRTRIALDDITLNYADQMTSQEAGDVLIDLSSVLTIPYEIQRRLLVLALQYVGRKPYAPRSEALLELEIAIEQSGKHTLAGCLVTKKGDCLRVSRELQAVKSLEGAINHTWDDRWEILGTASKNLTVRALGVHIKQVPDWRDVGLPRDSLMSSPAVFDGETLISAPVAGLNSGFEARIVTDFSSFLLSR